MINFGFSLAGLLAPDEAGALADSVADGAGVAAVSSSALRTSARTSSGIFGAFFIASSTSARFSGVSSFSLRSGVPTGKKAGGQKERDADEQIKPERMEIAGALPGDELVCEPTRPPHQQADGLDEFRIPIEKRFRDIRDDVAKRAPVIDRHLPAL